jgi:hypothetical protein
LNLQTEARYAYNSGDLRGLGAGAEVVVISGWFETRLSQWRQIQEIENTLRVLKHHGVIVRTETAEV